MATNTYVALQTTTVSGTSTGTITFTSIPSTYTDLVIVGNLGSETTNAFPYLQFNGDTGSNYSYTELYGNGSSAYSTRVSNNTQLFNNDVSVKQGSINSNVIYHIMNYANTTTYKTSLVRQNTVDAADYNGALAAVGLWRNTAAITSISIKLTRSGSAYNFSSGSTFTIYGIANADNFTKATGGIISEDSTYTYHVFGSSGTFTPKQSLTADILVVAGGGGGGNFGGGGGGAGGLQGFTSQSLSATSYTVTVGAGGAGGAANSALYGTAGGNSQFGALTASVGGGRGGGRATSSPGTTGGSGGGNAYSLGSLAGTSGQGYAGGAGTSYGGGGGGGAGEAGNTDAGQGDGGDGVSTYSSWYPVTLFGENVGGSYYLAGGGGGFGDNGVGGAGGSGGGGTGTSSTSVRRDGLAFTGSGGGATSQSVAGGNGGTGVVIIRYPK